MKLQIVVDQLIAECLVQLPGKTKVDKIRWAFCIYLETNKAMKRGDVHTPVSEIMARAGERYRHGHPTLSF